RGISSRIDSPWQAGRSSGLLLDPDPAILELPRFRLEADPPLGRDPQRLLQHLPVARALGDGPLAVRVGLDRDLDVVPAPLVELLELGVRPDRRVVAHLELRAPQVE